MYISVFNKSLLTPQSIRQIFKTNVTKNADSQRWPADHPLTAINAIAELTDPNAKAARDFSILDEELDHYFVTLACLMQDGANHLVLSKARHIKHLELTRKDGYTFSLISGSLNDWKSDLTKFLTSNTLNLREFGTASLKALNTLGITNSLLERPITEKLDTFYSLERS